MGDHGVGCWPLDRSVDVTSWSPFVLLFSVGARSIVDLRGHEAHDDRILDFFCPQAVDGAHAHQAVTSAWTICPSVGYPQLQGTCPDAVPKTFGLIHRSYPQFLWITIWAPGAHPRTVGAAGWTVPWGWPVGRVWLLGGGRRIDRTISTVEHMFDGRDARSGGCDTSGGHDKAHGRGWS